MAKGMYSFIGYPKEQPPEYANEPTEFVGIEKVCEDILKLGGEYAYILHNRDVKDDGTPKKYHYHILAGFETKFPTWKDFRQWLELHGCLCPSGGGDTGKPYQKYDYDKAFVRNPMGMYEYLTHENE